MKRLSNLYTTNIENQKCLWTELPSELLSLIGDRLSLLDLLSFRAVCKDWRPTTTTGFARIERAYKEYPYFILQKDDGKCILYDQTTKTKHIVNIPELNNATCLASNQGWLLIFQQGSLFFFCPFTKARIDLPKFPHEDISDHIAAFISPVSSDSTISIVNKMPDDPNKVELHVIKRGDETWTKHEYNRNFGDFKCATYDKGTFYFVDNAKKLATFSLENDKADWEAYTIVGSGKKGVDVLPFGYGEAYSVGRKLKTYLELKDEDSISTCGVVLLYGDCEFLVSNENLNGSSESMEEGRKLKGVWIQPRFHQISPNQRW